MNHITTQRIDPVQLRKASLVLRAIYNPFAREILQTLSELGTSTVSEIESHIRHVRNIRITQSETSTHLSRMCKCKIVTYTKSGKYHYYKINLDRISQISNAVKKS